jgi:hypothetical protein
LGRFDRGDPKGLNEIACATASDGIPFGLFSISVTSSSRLCCRDPRSMAAALPPVTDSLETLAGGAVLSAAVRR